MSHLASGSWKMLFIKMESHSGNGQRAIETRPDLWICVQPYIAQQIDDSCRLHDRDISQRQVADSPYSLFKLACRVRTLTGVVAVVGPWRQFIDKQVTILRDKHFDRQQPFQFEVFSDGKSNLLCLRCKSRWNTGWNCAPNQDLSLMMVD